MEKGKRRGREWGRGKSLTLSASLCMALSIMSVSSGVSGSNPTSSGGTNTSTSNVGAFSKPLVVKTLSSSSEKLA